jgi:hypothetical protein
MTRRDWVLTVGAGLCAGLAPACSHTLPQSRAGVSSDTDGIACAAPPEPQPVPAAPGSPYHPLADHTPGSAEGRLERMRDAAVRPAGESDFFPASNRPSPQLSAEPVREAETVVVKAQPEEDPPLVAALRCFLRKRPAEAVVWLERYDKANQDVLLCLLPLAARMTEGNLRQGDPHELTAVLSQLDGVSDSLQPLAELRIERMCFCRDIKKYGDYTPLEDDHGFRPLEWAQVYVELQNFSSEQQGNLYKVHLTSKVEVDNFRGKFVWRQDFPADPVISLTRRRDFFNTYTFSVPKIPPGRYTLKLTVTDVPTKRRAERTLDFRVVEQGP